MVRASVVGLVLAASWPLQAAQLPGDGTAAPFQIIEQDLRSVLTDFAESFDLPVDIDEDVKGTVRQVTGDFTPKGFLQTLALAHNFSWYYDGQVIHIAPLQKNRTIILQLGDVGLDRLQRALDDLNISDDRYPILPAGDQGLARASGPARYVELVQETFQAISAPESQSTPARRLIVIQGDETEILPDGKPEEQRETE